MTTRHSAGKLGFDSINRQVEVTYTNGNITSTVRDVLTKVQHSSEGTRIFFQGTQWTSPSLFGPVDEGLLVGPTHVITLYEE